jgi:outer membrane protein
VEATPLACLAMSVIGLVFVGTSGAQEPPPPEETPAPAPIAYPEVDTIVGPTPGAPTISVADAVNLALEKNFGLLSAADSVLSARFRETASAAQFHPMVTPRYQRSADNSVFGVEASQRVPWTGATVTASGAYRSLDSGLGGPPSSSDVRVALSQPLLRGFGPTYTQFDLTNSKRAVQAQERSFELFRQRLAVEVIAGFYQVVRQRQLVEVSRQSLERSEGLAAASEARLKVGLASKLDLFRAQIQASQAQESMVQSGAALQGALEDFRLVLGLGPGDVLEPEGVALPEPRAGEFETAEVLVSRALQNRIELKELRDQVDDARRSLVVARQNLLPQLDVGVAYSRLGFGSSFSDSFRGTDSRVDFFLSTSYPLERANERANKAVAELDLVARERNLRQRELEIEAEVRAALRSLERIQKSVELQTQGLDFATQQHRLATLRYQRGLASNFDVVDAEGSLVSARSSLVSLLTDHQVARAQLLRAVGTFDVEAEYPR